MLPSEGAPPKMPNIVVCTKNCKVEDAKTFQIGILFVLKLWKSEGVRESQ
jgi:hypothetical protein